MFLFNCFAYCMTFQLRPPEIKKDQTKSKPSHWYTFFFLRSYKCVLAGTHLTDFHWIYFSFVLTFFLSSISFRTFKFLCAFFFSQFILLSLWACFFFCFFDTFIGVFVSWAKEFLRWTLVMWIRNQFIVHIMHDIHSPYITIKYIVWVSICETNKKPTIVRQWI